MQYLHEMTIEQLHHLDRKQLISLLIEHDRDGEYSDEQRIALGEVPLNHDEALNLAIYNLEEALWGMVITQIVKEKM